MMTHATPTDTRLRWTMRLVGLVLAAACIYLLSSELVHTQEAIAFLGIAAALGTITFISSWFASPHTPAPERAQS